jgi:hypothetical protein
MALTIDEKRQIVNLIRGEVNEMFHRHYDKYHSPENERLKQEIDDIKTNSRLYNTAIQHDIEGWKEKANYWNRLVTDIVQWHDSSDVKAVVDLIIEWKQDAKKWRNLSNGAESMGFSLEQAMEWKEKANKWDNFASQHDVTKYENVYEKAKKWDEYGALDDSYNEIVEDAKKWRSFGMFVTLKEVEEMKQDAYKWREHVKEWNKGEFDTLADLFRDKLRRIQDICNESLTE